MTIKVCDVCDPSSVMSLGPIQSGHSLLKPSRGLLTGWRGDQLSAWIWCRAKQQATNVHCAAFNEGVRLSRPSLRAEAGALPNSMFTIKLIGPMTPCSADRAYSNLTRRHIRLGLSHSRFTLQVDYILSFPSLNFLDQMKPRILLEPRTHLKKRNSVLRLTWASTSAPTRGMY